MKLKEDVLLSIRGIKTRPVESLLLIFGIALGIGATAAGFALVILSVSQSEQLLAQTTYREIVVSTRERSVDMDIPAVREDIENNIILTALDLEARNYVQGIEYAYIANRVNFRLRGFPQMRFIERQQGDTQPEAGNREMMIMESPPGEEQPPEMDAEMQRRMEEQMEEMRQFLEEAPEVEGPQPVIDEMQGYTVSPEFFSAWHMQAAQGSLFTEVDMQNREPVIILGAEVAKNIFEDGIALDRELLIRRELYRITGILQALGNELDDMAFIPTIQPDAENTPAFARRFMGFNTSLYFTATSADQLDEVKNQLQTWFDNEHGPGLVVINIPRVTAEAIENRTNRTSIIILILAISGLLIAAINVSNILYSRAVRKQKAVGILKAMGASVHNVFELFFLEALFIVIGGAILGIGFSVLMSYLLEITMGFKDSNPLLLAIGIFLAWIITSVLTIIPALQTAGIPAAEAIRYE